jgi:hypothetical protein
MQRHRIGNGAVAVEEIGSEGTGGQFQFHAERNLLVEWLHALSDGAKLWFLRPSERRQTQMGGSIQPDRLFA